MNQENAKLFIGLMPVDDFLKLQEEQIVRTIKKLLNSNPVNGEELLTIERTCELFQISKVTLHKWKKSGRLPYVKVDRKVYFKASDITEFLKDHKRFGNESAE